MRTSSVGPMAFGLATGLGGAAAVMAFGWSLLAAFLAYSLCGALGVLISGIAQARSASARDAETSAPSQATPPRDMARDMARVG